MTRSLALGRWESGIARLLRLPRRPIIAGGLSGVVAGIALGSITGPVGVVLGMWMGVGVGLVTGYVLAREDATRSARTQELDTIIGITTGSMGSLGAPKIALKEDDADEIDLPVYSSKEAWLTEWLTPPPPSVAAR
jgi:hypothetical protein